MQKQAIWQQIRQTLAEEIASGHYPKGEKLPTESSLATRFSVNRHTIRRALANLQDEGIIHVRQGAGAYVNQTQVDYKLGRKTRFSQNIDGTGLSRSRETLRLETLPASEREADVLNLPNGSRVHVFEAISIVDGAPFSYGRSVFPATLLPDLLNDLRETNSITAALEANGIADYTRAWTNLTAKRARGTVARTLQLPEGAPVLRSVSLNVDVDKRPLEYGRTWFHGDRAQLVVDDTNDVT